MTLVGFMGCDRQPVWINPVMVATVEPCTKGEGALVILSGGPVIQTVERAGGASSYCSMRTRSQRSARGL